MVKRRKYSVPIILPELWIIGRHAYFYETERKEGILGLTLSVVTHSLTKSVSIICGSAKQSIVCNFIGAYVYKIDVYMFTFGF